MNRKSIASLVLAILAALAFSICNGCFTPPAPPTSKAGTGIGAGGHVVSARAQMAESNRMEKAKATRAAADAAITAQYRCTTNGGAITINRYIGSTRDAAIPGKINGLPVTAIGEGAFSSCASLTNVTIPASIVSIDEYAFSSCTGLTNVTIPASTRSLGSGVFWGCTGLIDVAVPTGIATIPQYAYWGCTRLRWVTIPDNVTKIGVGAFWGCTNLPSVTIPRSVTSIGTDAFPRRTKVIRSTAVPR